MSWSGKRFTDSTRPTLFAPTSQSTVEFETAARTGSQAITSKNQKVVQDLHNLSNRNLSLLRTLIASAGLRIRSFVVNVRCFYF